MTLARGRVLRAPSGAIRIALRMEPVAIGRRMARLEVEARERADGVVEAATRRATTMLQEVERRAGDLRTAALESARAEALAETAALALLLRKREAEADDRGRERLIAVASLLAERLLGHALATHPEEVRALAAQALSEAGGARRVELHAHPEDAALLRSGIATAGFDPDGRVHAVVSDESLARGDLRLNTELGMIDARLGPELARLAERLREALSS